MNNLRELIQARLDVREQERTAVAAHKEAAVSAIADRVRREAGRSVLVHLRVRMKWARDKAEIQMLCSAAEVYAKQYPELADEFRALISVVTL